MPVYHTIICLFDFPPHLPKKSSTFS
jgi:hypothetical protein